MAAYPADAGVLSADRSRQRMAAAPAMVRAERDGNLLGEGSLAGRQNSLYRCLDKVVPHKAALFSHLRQRWQDLSEPRSMSCCTI